MKFNILISVQWTSNAFWFEFLKCHQYSLNHSLKTSYTSITFVATDNYFNYHFELG